ncbi:cell division protein FtsA [uncultured Clostridium sp.]|uniref:cell division protein FtsA n=1 Tax=uncultured Clostridium sp. TaxID=59620 RepID=UPI0028E5F593|nr:cell division protein FtsA [uncultured Clostridium sp.]
MNEYVVGIDIGSSKVCAAAGRLDRNNKIQIIGIASTPCSGLKRGIVVDIDSTAEGIIKALEQLERMIDSKIKDIYISIPGEICEITSNRGVVAVSAEDREITKNDVDRVLKAAKIISVPSDKEIVGVVPEQFVVDGYDNITDPVGMCGMRLEVDSQIIMCQSTIISNLFKSINKAGFQSKGMVFQPIATALSVIKSEEMKIGTLLLDIGAETTNISVFKDNRLVFNDKLPLGGNTITNDISLCLKLPQSEAEKVKIKYGNIADSFDNEDFKIRINANYDSIVEVSNNLLNDIIAARIEEIMYLLKKNLDLHGYLEEISGIVVVGGGISLVKGSIDICREILGKPVRIGIPEYIGAEDTMYSSAIGVVKDVISSGKVDFKEEKVTKEKKKSDVKSIWNDEDDEDNDEDDDGFFSKIKGFFTDFF